MGRGLSACLGCSHPPSPGSSQQSRTWPGRSSAVGAPRLSLFPGGDSTSLSQRRPSHLLWGAATADRSPGELSAARTPTSPRPPPTGGWHQPSSQTSRLSMGTSAGHGQWAGWGSGDPGGLGWLCTDRAVVPADAGSTGSVLSLLVFLNRRLIRFMSRGLSSTGGSAGPSPASAGMWSWVRAPATAGSPWGPVSASVWGPSGARSSSNPFFPLPRSCSLESWLSSWSQRP